MNATVAEQAAAGVTAPAPTAPAPASAPGWEHQYEVPVDPMDLLQCESCQ